MKHFPPLFLGLLLFILMPFQDFAQKSQFKDATITVSLPVTLHFKKVNQRHETGVEKVTFDQEKATSVGFYMKVPNVRITGNTISGIGTKKDMFSNTTCILRGTMSQDHKSIVRATLDFNYVKYANPNWEKARIEETRKVSLTVGRLPEMYDGKYQYKFGETTISDVEYEKTRHLVYRADANRETETLVNFDAGKISKYANPVSIVLQNSPNPPEWLKADTIAIGIDKVKNEDVIGKRTLTGIATMISDPLTKIPGLVILDRLMIDKRQKEIQLSQSGLVNPESTIDPGKLLDPDVYILVTLTSRKPADISLPPEILTVKTVILDRKTGQLIDPGLYFTVELDNPKSWSRLNDYTNEVVDYIKLLL